MKKIDFKSEVLPHLIAIGIFLLLVIAYFTPVFLEGKTIKQGDVLTWGGNSAQIYQHRAKYGDEPLWTNASFSGMPAYTISVLYPGELLEYLEKALTLGLPYPVSIVFIGLLSYYILLLAYGVETWLAILGAIAFTFFSFNFISLEAGHNSKLRAMTFAPLLLAGIVLAYRGKWLRGFILAALGTALQVRSGHYQITYYVGILVVFAGINELVFAIKDKKIKDFAIATLLLGLAAGLGIATNAGRLMTLQEYTQYSMRGKPELVLKDDNKPKDGGLDKDYVFSWSFSRMETLTMLIPGLYGGSSSEPISKNSEAAKLLKDQGINLNEVGSLPYYWGDQPFTSGPVYSGAIVIFLCVLGLFVLDNRYKYWLFAASFFSILLTMGKHFPLFNYWMYDHFPGYNKFRTVTMAVVIAEICMPILAVLAVDAFSKLEKTPKNLKKLYYSVGIAGGVALLFALVPSIAGNFSNPQDASQGIPNWLLPALEEDRVSMARGDAFRSFIFISLAAVVLFLALQKTLRVQIVTFILIGLTLFDLWAVDKRYLNKDNFERKKPEDQILPTAADNEIKKDKSPGYRVLNLNNPFNESRTSAHHNSIGGYSPVKLRRYQDLIQNDITTEIETLIGSLKNKQFSLELLQNQHVLAMLNTRYIKANEDADGVITNPYALGNAWFVADVQKVQNPNEEIAALSKFNPKTTSILDVNKFKLAREKYDTTGATIKLTEYRSNLLEYDCNSPGNGLIVFSEIYYPEGWVVELDGKVVEEIRVNYILRALEVSPGKHKIKFSFKPKSYSDGNLISMVSSLGLLLLVFGAIAYDLRGKKPNGQN